jgi:hypothetical protein
MIIVHIIAIKEVRSIKQNEVYDEKTIYYGAGCDAFFLYGTESDELDGRFCWDAFKADSRQC